MAGDMAEFFAGRPVKEFTLVKRRDDVSAAALEQGVTELLPTLRSSHGASNAIWNAVVGTGPRGDVFPFDGVLQRNLRSVHDDLLPEWARLLAPLADLGSSLTLRTWENVVLDARAPAKIIICSRRSPRVSAVQYSRHWRTRHVEVIKAQPDFMALHRGYIQNHVVPGSASLVSGLAATPAQAFDGVIEMWWDTPESTREAYRTNGYQRQVRADEPNFIAVGQSIAAFVEERR